jgi:hypothetical protein
VIEDSDYSFRWVLDYSRMEKACIMLIAGPPVQHRIVDLLLDISSILSSVGVLRITTSHPISPNTLPAANRAPRRRTTSYLTACPAPR